MDKKEHLKKEGIKKIFYAIKKMNRANKDITEKNLKEIIG